MTDELEFPEIPDAESLSEVSEELDSKLWQGRFANAWDAIREAAGATQNAREWMAAWIPAGLALQQIAMRSTELTGALRSVVLDGEEFDLDEEFIESFREELRGLADVFPDAGHLFVGVEVIDAAVDRTLQSEAAREEARTLMAGVENLVGDIVASMIDIWLDPERFTITPEQAAIYLNRVEAILQRLIDRIIENANWQ